MKKAAMFMLAFVIGDWAYAGFNGLTIHSRANCVNNESISWDWTHYWNLNTSTSHYLNGRLVHSYQTGWINTWRSAAVCWGEGKGGWTVIGAHYIAYRAGDLIPLGTTNVSDCSVYNGWWDKDK